MPADHDHASALTATGRHRGRLAAVMGITAGIAAAEIIGAVVSGSLVLLADAAHMAADAAGVGLSVLAAYFAARPATDRRTFGYARPRSSPRRSTPCCCSAWPRSSSSKLCSGSLRRQPVGSGLMIVFGVVALAGNGVSLLLLRHGQDRESQRPGGVPRGRIGHLRARRR